MQKEACERYQNLSKEEKGKRRQYGHERYRNFWENGKQKPVECRNILWNAKKLFIIVIRNYLPFENLVFLDKHVHFFLGLS